MSKNNLQYDLIIIGGGPAGLSAAIYASRYRLSVAVISTSFQNPTLAEHQIANYLGFGEISGFELWEKMFKHTESFNIPLITDTVLSVKPVLPFQISTLSSSVYSAPSIILASGAKRNRLGLKNEDKFSGHGVSYCAACDAPFFRGLPVAVIGGSNSALTEAAHLAEFASEVFLIVRATAPTADASLIEKIHSLKNLTLITETNVVALNGADSLSSIILDHPHTLPNQPSPTELLAKGLFISVGSTPDTEFISNLGLSLNEQNKIIVGRDQKTNLPGIWAAGDSTTGSNGLKQIITACAEGAIAAADIFSTLKVKK